MLHHRLDHFAVNPTMLDRMRPLGINAMRFFDIVSLRYMNDPANNGRFIITYQQCVAAGMSRRLVKAAIDQMIAANLVRVTRGKRRQPNRYGLPPWVVALQERARKEGYCWR